MTHIVRQDDKLRRPAVVIAAETYDVDFSHSGRKIAEKLRESKGNRVRLPLDSQRFVLASILNAP
jgi:hypothetical protein